MTQNEILLWIESELENEVHNKDSALWKDKDTLIQALALVIYGWGYGGPSKFQRLEGEPLVSIDLVNKDEYIQSAKAILVMLKLLNVRLTQE